MEEGREGEIKKKGGKEASIGEDVEKLEPLCIASGNLKWYGARKYSMAVSQKKKFNNMELPYDPVIPILVIYPKELKTETHILMCQCSLQHYS